MFLVVSLGDLGNFEYPFQAYSAQEELGLKGSYVWVNRTNYVGKQNDMLNCDCKKQDLKPFNCGPKRV